MSGLLLWNAETLENPLKLNEANACKRKDKSKNFDLMSIFLYKSIMDSRSAI